MAGSVWRCRWVVSRYRSTTATTSSTSHTRTGWRTERRSASARRSRGDIMNMNTRLGRVAGCLAIAFATARCADKIAPPTASAGAAVTADVGSSVSLDGTQSKDPQGRALAYDWTFASRPAASRASFNDAHIATPSFVPDLDAQYAVSLVVSNGVLSSPASQVMVTVRRCGQAAPDIRSVTASSANPNVENSVQLSADVHDADNDSACALGQTRTLLWTAVSRPGAS